MGVMASINFEVSPIAPIDRFLLKTGVEDNLHPLIESRNGLLGILHPSIEILKTPLLYRQISRAHYEITNVCL